MKRKQPTEEPALLRVFKASGEELASIPTDDVVNAPRSNDGNFRV